MEERLEDAFSNVGNGEKDVGGMVSCGSCDRAGFVDSDGDCGVLHVVKREKNEKVGTKKVEGGHTHLLKVWE
jgi:hypothetical protein